MAEDKKKPIDGTDFNLSLCTLEELYEEIKRRYPATFLAVVSSLEEDRWLTQSSGSSLILRGLLEEVRDHLKNQTSTRNLRDGEDWQRGSMEEDDECEEAG